VDIDRLHRVDKSFLSLNASIDKVELFTILMNS